MTTAAHNRFFCFVSTSHSTLSQRTLGKNGPTVAAIGLGCMGMSDFYGPADESESLRTIHAALDAEVNLLDTGDFYGMGHNEMLLSQALKTRRKEAFVCVKFGTPCVRQTANSSDWICGPAYGVFSRGLLSTVTKIPEVAKGDFRGAYPRFQGENFQRNRSLLESLRTIAAREGCTLPQLAR